MGLLDVDLLEIQRSEGFPELRRLLDTHRIEFLELEVLGDWHLAPGPARDRSDEKRRFLLDAAAQLGALRIKCVGRLEPSPIDTVAAARELSILADEAASVGASIALEFMPFGDINSPEIGVEIVQRAAHPMAGIFVDIWHVVRGGVDLETVRKLPKELIQGFELDDARLTWEGSMLNDTFEGRLLPGEGEFDIAGFVDAARTTGFDGYWNVEIIGRRFRERPDYEVAVADAFSRTASFLE
jgi:sugar phosphate isomerase/epimerase